MKYRIILLLSMLWVGLAGCNPRVQPAQISQTDLVELNAETPVGQTFVARYDGLQAIQVYLSPGPAGEGVLSLHLRSEPGTEQDLATVTMPLSQVTQPATYRFDFKSLSNSNQQYYYALFEVEGGGNVYLGASAGSTYLDGAMYQQGTPRDGQLTFSLEYEAGKLAVGLGLELVQFAGVMGLSVLLSILPGWAMLGWLWRGWKQLSWGEKTGLAAGFSLALSAILMMLTDWIGLHLGAGYAWIMVMLGLFGLLAGWFRDGGLLSKLRSVYLFMKNPFNNVRSILPDAALVILIGILLTSRWWAIREIEAPMWGDSVQHAVIAQLIVDNNGLFQDWSPYAPYESLTVQHVFSEAVAMFTWLSGMEAWRATLWVGQILNGLAILAIYPLAVKVSAGNRWAGWAAILVAGLISSLPAFYVNWGRYAQLTGQVLLPVVMYLIWVLVEDHRDPDTRLKTGRLAWRQFGKQIDWGLIVLGGIGLAGMLLAYYRTAYQLAVFVIALGLAWGIGRWKANILEWLFAGLKLATLAVAGALLFLPWAVRMSNSLLAETFESNASGVTGLQAMLTSYRGTYQTIYDHYPQMLLIFAGACLVWSILRKKWKVVMIGLWTAGMILLPAGKLIGIPGVDFITHFSILILLYMPIGMISGWLLGQLIDWLWRKSSNVARVVITCILIGVSAWFAWGQRDLSQPELFAMVTRPDLRAMQWIEENTDNNARFLVEGFRIYNGNSAVGSDAGWWIPVLAKRQNTMPPQYAMLDEIPKDPAYTRQITGIVAALEITTLDTMEGVEILCENGISHIYIGQRQGLVSAEPVIQLFSPDELRNQPLFDLVYAFDRVTIYALRDEACEGN